MAWHDQFRVQEILKIQVYRSTIVLHGVISPCLVVELLDFKTDIIKKILLQCTELQTLLVMDAMLIFGYM